MYGCFKDGTDDLRITYGLVTDINYSKDPLMEKSRSLIFLWQPQTLHIHGGCHKDIADGPDVFMDENYDP